MKSIIDFHMHSNHSDGTDSPSELMKRCARRKLSCVSLTDHDTLSSYAEAKQEADLQGIRLVAGIEISVDFEPGSLHILGYFVDPENQALQACLEEVQRAREERNPRIIRALNDLGFEIEMQDVLEAAGQQGECPKQIGRPHIAKALVKKGHVKNVDDAFRRFLAKGKPACIEKWCVSSKQAIEMIRGAGGVASVAHPVSLRLDGEDLYDALKQMTDEGLEALEVYHSSHKPRHRNDFLDIANRLGLTPTGGSDYHGRNKPGLDVGFLGRGICLDEGAVDALEQKTKRNEIV